MPSIERPGKAIMTGQRERTYERRDPIIRALMESVSLDHPGFFVAINELYILEHVYGVELTPDIARRVGQRAAQRRPVPKRSTQPPRNVVDSVVYYVRIGNRVKIGTSASLKSRLESINPEELMAIEPGDRELEGRRHREFSHLRTHGEWFDLASPLKEHIADLRRKHLRFTYDRARAGLSLRSRRGTTP